MRIIKYLIIIRKFDSGQGTATGDDSSNVNLEKIHILEPATIKRRKK